MTETMVLTGLQSLVTDLVRILGEVAPQQMDVLLRGNRVTLQKMDAGKEPFRHEIQAYRVEVLEAGLGRRP